MDAVEGNVQLLAERFAEQLITIRLFTPQMKITMDGFKSIAKTLQNKQHAHTIRAA